MNIGIIQCIIPKILHIYSSLIILCASDAAPERIYRQQKTAPAARFLKWRQQDSNLRPFTRQANALPAELCLRGIL